MPNIYNDYFVRIIQDLIDYTVITHPDAVKVFSACKLMGFRGKRIRSELFNMLKNGGNEIPGNLPEVFFYALPENERIFSHASLM